MNVDAVNAPVLEKTVPLGTDPSATAAKLIDRLIEWSLKKAGYTVDDLKSGRVKAHRYTTATCPRCFGTGWQVEYGDGCLHMRICSCTTIQFKETCESLSRDFEHE